MLKSFGRGCIPFALMVLPAAAAAQDAAASARGAEMFNQCAEIANDAQRLACFDRVTREMRAAASPGAVAGSTRPASPQQSARREREDFGLDEQQMREDRSRPAPLKQITARVAAAKMVGPGYWAFLLDDGAIWQMSELEARFRPPSAGETVRVRRGLLGGFLMDTKGQAAVRVKRLS